MQLLPIFLHRRKWLCLALQPLSTTGPLCQLSSLSPHGPQAPIMTSPAPPARGHMRSPRLTHNDWTRDEEGVHSQPIRAKKAFVGTFRKESSLQGGPHMETACLWVKPREASRSTVQQTGRVLGTLREPLGAAMPGTSHPGAFSLDSSPLAFLCKALRQTHPRVPGNTGHKGRIPARPLPVPLCSTNSLCSVPRC